MPTTDNALPPVLGFHARVGARGEPGPAPRRITAGEAVPFTGGTCSGRLLAGSGPAVPRTADGVTTLLAGELYHRDGLPAALGGIADDAELLLEIWLRYGRAGLRLCNGRFAAVVVEADSVVIATDHAGSVPLYVRREEGAVHVATEAKALAGGGVDLALPGTEPVPGTPGVLRVRAGSAVTLRPAGPIGAAEWTRTWTPPLHRLALPPARAVRRVADALDAAVRTRVRGPVTAVLSGGVDSGSVAALASRAGGRLTTVSLGTDAGDEFAAARVVAEHVGSDHREFRCGAEDLVRQLPWAVAAAEIVDAEVIEYLLPLVVLYRALPPGGRLLTGYGADIPLGGMHRGTAELASLDDVIAADMAGFDGLNELSPVLSTLAGQWTTHPFWDRDVLDLLTALEPGLKRRDGRDKWVLREAVRDLLPESTVRRPKLGVHEGSGTTGAWTRLLLAHGVRTSEVGAVKNAMTAAIHRRVVGAGEHPDAVSFDDVLAAVLATRAAPVIPAQVPPVWKAVVS
ncbi:asparagine synthase-related protein [Saccharothrix luteola]|uniref:asparagine synthase-related protein n=1 Tax=Saccharothrix luteola TaxID=2893018 RepID=UPI001E31216E|nr:asparagine synthase-related protein [Saccharothrix luteola]MCC8246427.1 asparagine synthase C-terminal domain-containing protein [Saccharothrix luteola]